VIDTLVPCKLDVECGPGTRTALMYDLRDIHSHLAANFVKREVRL